MVIRKSLIEAGQFKNLLCFTDAPAVTFYKDFASFSLAIHPVAREYEAMNHKSARGLLARSENLRQT